MNDSPKIYTILLIDMPHDYIASLGDNNHEIIHTNQVMARIIDINLDNLTWKVHYEKSFAKLHYFIKVDEREDYISLHLVSKILTKDAVDYLNSALFYDVLIASNKMYDEVTFHPDMKLNPYTELKSFTPVTRSFENREDRLKNILDAYIATFEATEDDDYTVGELCSDVHNQMDNIADTLELSPDPIWGSFGVSMASYEDFLKKMHHFEESYKLIWGAMKGKQTDSIAFSALLDVIEERFEDTLDHLIDFGVIYKSFKNNIPNLAEVPENFDISKMIDNMYK